MVRVDKNIVGSRCHEALFFTSQEALNAELTKVETSLDQKSSELEAAKIESSDKEETICRIQKNSELEKSKLEARIVDLERAKEILLEAKVELQNEVDGSGKQMEALKAQLSAATSQIDQLKVQHEAQIKSLKQEMVS